MKTIKKHQLDNLEAQGFCEGWGIVTAGYGLAGYLGLTAVNPVAGGILAVGALGCAIYGLT